MSLDIRRKTPNGENLYEKFRLRSPAFHPYGEIPTKYTFLGDNISPPFEIYGVPNWANSLILIIEDLEVPKGFLNWVVYDILPEIIVIDEDTTPGKACRNSTRKLGYIGFMPIKEVHQIRFTLIAVDNNIILPEFVNVETIFENIRTHRHLKTELIGILVTKATHWAIE